MSLGRSGAHTLDALVSPRQLNTTGNHPTRSAQQIPTWLCRSLQRVRHEGEQYLRVEPMVVGVWAGYAASGGAVGG